MDGKSEQLAGAEYWRAMYEESEAKLAAERERVCRWKSSLCGWVYPCKGECVEFPTKYCHMCGGKVKVE